MHLLVVSHSCATAINQQFYADLQQVTGWEITLLVPGNWINEYGKPIASQWPGFHGRIIYRDVWKSGNIILHAYRGSMKRLLTDVNPDVIYVNHEPYAVATAQIFWANRRSIARPIGFYSCQNIVKKYPPPFRWTESFVYRQSSFSFPITASVDAVHRAKGYLGPSTLMPLGLDPSVYHRHDDNTWIRSDLGAEPGQVLLGFLGRFVPEKGLATLLNALAKIRHLNWQLALIGAGPFETELRRLIDQLSLSDRVTLRGYIPHPDAPKYFSAFDVTLLPSETQPNWKEQFGRVILESLACGTSVIGSNSGEIGTLVNELGGGLVFPERDANALAAAIAQLIESNSLRMSLAQNGQQKVLESYTTKTLAARFAQTIEGAAKAGVEKNQ